MIQILGLRPYTDKKSGKEKLSEKFFEKGWRAETLEDILQNYQQLLANIPTEEHHNLYFTVADCHEESGRKLKLQHHIAIDVDGMFIKEKEDGSIDETCFTPVIEAFEKVTKLRKEQVGILFSGHGLWFYIRVAEPISDDEYFKQTRLYYKALADALNIEFKKRLLPCKTDPTAWSGARLSRMPGTWNIKKDKPKRRAYVLQANIEEIDTDIKRLCGVPEIDSHHHVNTETLRKDFPPADVKEILHPSRGCNFLYWAMTNQKDVKEAEWFAVLGLAGRFPNGRELAHNFSKEHPGYDHDETELKLTHALFYGPRTCKGIEAISDKCKNCPHHNTALVSPIMIRGEDYILTEKTGFRKQGFDANGNPKAGEPQISDLVRYFKREEGYFLTPGDTDIIEVFDGKIYKERSKLELLAYAQKKFVPEVKQNVKVEFYNNVLQENVKQVDILQRFVENKVNFKNCVLDVTTREVLPHSNDYYFKNHLDCEYDPMAIAPNWEKFIYDVTCGDQEMMDVLQEYVGYAIASAECREQKALFLYGTGANGKSVFTDVMKALVGKTGYSALSLTDMQNPAARYSLVGKTINVSSENSDRTSFEDASAFKALVVGEDILVKKLHVNESMYKGRVKFFILLNKMPKSRDDSDGFYRRMIVVPFRQQFSEALGNLDKNIIDKLIKELPGIMNWALKGAERLLTQGKFTQCRESDKLLNQYKQDSSDINRFFSEVIEPSADGRVTRDEIFSAFKDWALDEGLNMNFYTRNKIFVSLREFGLKNPVYVMEEKAFKISGKVVRGFSGIKLNTEAPKDNF